MSSDFHLFNPDGINSLKLNNKAKPMSAEKFDRLAVIKLKIKN